MIEFPPGLLLIIGAIFVPLLPQVVRNAYMLALPVIGFWGLLMIPEGVHFAFDIFGYTLSPVRVDGLSLIFGYIFHFAAAINIIQDNHINLIPHNLTISLGKIDMCTCKQHAFF